jgi:hypothetical protein
MKRTLSAAALRFAAEAPCPAFQLWVGKRGPEHCSVTSAAAWVTCVRHSAVRRALCATAVAVPTRRPLVKSSNHSARVYLTCVRRWQRCQRSPICAATNGAPILGIGASHSLHRCESQHRMTEWATATTSMRWTLQPQRCDRSTARFDRRWPSSAGAQQGWRHKRSPKDGDLTASTQRG